MQAPSSASSYEEAFNIVNSVNFRKMTLFLLSRSNIFLSPLKIPIKLVTFFSIAPDMIFPHQ